MLSFDKLQQIHLEITNRCQASCPMCNRNIHGGLENPLIKNADWSFDDFTSILPVSLLQSLHGIYFCGNFGDPIVNKDLDKMCKYVAESAPLLELVIHTNGSMRTAQWWADLPAKLPKNHRVVFAIDGLEDTHSLYRIGTNYHSILDNAQAFIKSGGIAEWVFIKFKHNEHQIDRAKQIAQELGFAVFTVKNSTRFIGEPKFEVYNKQGGVEYHLEPPTDNQVKLISYDIINNYRDVIKNAKINCDAAKHNEIYIDAYKHLYPCCYLGSVPYTHTDKDITFEVRTHIQEQHREYIEFFGGYNAIDTTRQSIKSIMDATPWNTAWDRYWNGSNKLIMCARVCGEIPEITGSKKQIIEITNIKNQTIGNANER